MVSKSTVSFYKNLLFIYKSCIENAFLFFLFIQLIKLKQVEYGRLQSILLFPEKRCTSANTTSIVDKVIEGVLHLWGSFFEHTLYAAYYLQ